MSDVKKLNHEQVMEIIPHRDPMLLIDEATEFVPGERIVATFSGYSGLNPSSR